MRLSGVIGQARARAQLERELAADRLAHAYLFVGPAGVGRATTARALFMALNCAQPVDGRACGVCGHCRRATQGSHEELIVLEPPAGGPSSQIKVDDVREAIRRLAFPPHGVKRRLVLIRRAEAMNPSAANALLKTLEEPPAGNLIVLTAQDPGELLPTIVSRCRKVGFSPLNDDQIITALVQRGQDPDAARLAAGLAGGSLGRALALDPAELARRLENLTRALAHPAPPTEDWSLAEELVGAHKSGAGLDRQGLLESLELLLIYFRDLAVRAAGRAELACLRSGGQLPLDAATAAFAAVRRAQGQIAQNAAPELCLTVMLGQLRHRIAEAAHA